MRKAILSIFLLSVAFSAPAIAQETARPVKLMTVSASDLGLTRQFFGQVVARETVDLAFQVAGQIVEFPVVEGSPVGSGDLIARLDLENFELALQQATLNKEQADREVGRLEQLSAGAVAQATLDSARTQAALAKISVRNAEKALEDATLTSPFDGLVATRQAAKFSTIAAGTPVVRLHDLSELRIDIDVPEILFQRAGADPDVTITARFPASENDYPLEVREFNAEASQVGQTYTLTFGMANPDDLNVLPGSSVTVTARINSGESRPLIPASAVAVANDGSPSVFVFEPAGAEAGTVRRAAVTLEADPDRGFWVTEGLDADAEIVVAGVSALEDGMAVRRFTAFGE